MTMLVSILVSAAVGAVVSHVVARAIVGGHLPRYPRTLHRLWARLGGYFYLPCLACYRRFGGHEWRPSGVTGRTWVVGGRVICPVCTGRCDVLAVLDREPYAKQVATLAAATGLSRGRVRRAIAKHLDMHYVEATRLPPTGREHYRITDAGRQALVEATLPPNEYIVMSRGRGHHADA